jgi:hypothetical protein
MIGRAVEAQRAGFGIFYDLGQGSLGGVSSYFPYSASKNFFGSPFPPSAQNAASLARTAAPPVDTMLVADPHLKLPRSYQWNVAWEQALGGRQSVSMTYIGAIGRDLLRTTNLTALNPSFQSVSVTDDSATSDYHALQVKVQRRLSRGLQGLASYTLAHSIDVASSDAVGHYLGTPDSLARSRVDRGDPDFDVRHAVTAGITYDLPSPGGGKGVRAIFGGWSLTGFLLARSAPPSTSRAPSPLARARRSVTVPT